ncbi:MAG TPA: hypothetical protein VIG64_03225 [Actinomycetota bacterium]
MTKHRSKRGHLITAMILAALMQLAFPGSARASHQVCMPIVDLERDVVLRFCAMAGLDHNTGQLETGAYVSDHGFTVVSVYTSIGESAGDVSSVSHEIRINDQDWLLWFTVRPFDGLGNPQALVQVCLSRDNRAEEYCLWPQE